ncbi:DUF3833 domain-containing protein [Psychrosphaera sp. 1_MG-2023]|uniref:DUF3833 domain-containing protein n=1 Tax=Psychrosphaera sp. 1_MG-2023 TaxID=3062643 RepID=UPI0026E2C699|nr:DUF3833 domain-containing protein [Psychrosphaera sp. 1_MG-2023]MDO6720442.1 DUF3833 domain-containing protein [Psychrosphaera sp. 1_MG-2023]
MKQINKTLMATMIAGSIALIGGCSTDIGEYKTTAGNFQLETYFNGPVVAWGMIQDYTNKVNRRFCVELEGQWQQVNNQSNGQLNEWFYFDDGEVSQRIWNLTKTQNNQYSGTANDVVGVASGQTSGFAFQWQYNLSLDIDGSSYEFFLDDWMYQLDEYRVFNRTSMRKFGVEVAEITLFFDKQQPLRSCNKEVI